MKKAFDEAYDVLKRAQDQITTGPALTCIQAGYEDIEAVRSALDLTLKLPYPTIIIRGLQEQIREWKELGVDEGPEEFEQQETSDNPEVHEKQVLDNHIGIQAYHACAEILTDYINECLYK